MNSETAITPAPLPTITLPSLLSGFSGQRCLCLELDASGSFGGQLVDSALWRPADLFCDPILVPLAISTGQLDDEEAEFLMGVLDSDGVMGLCNDLLSLLRPYSRGRTVVNGLPSIRWQPEAGRFFDWFLDELAGTLAMRRIDQALRVAGDLNASHAEYLEDDLRSRVVSEYLGSVSWVTGQALAWSVRAGLGLGWMPILLPVESAFIQITSAKSKWRGYQATSSASLSYPDRRVIERLLEDDDFEFNDLLSDICFHLGLEGPASEFLDTRRHRSCSDDDADDVRERLAKEIHRELETAIDNRLFSHSLLRPPVSRQLREVHVGPISSPLSLRGKGWSLDHEKPRVHHLIQQGEE